MIVLFIFCFTILQLIFVLIRYTFVYQCCPVFVEFLQAVGTEIKTGSAQSTPENLVYSRNTNNVKFVSVFVLQKKK